MTVWMMHVKYWKNSTIQIFFSMFLCAQRFSSCPRATFVKKEDRCSNRGRTKFSVNKKCSVRSLCWIITLDFYYCLFSYSKLPFLNSLRGGQRGRLSRGQESYVSSGHGFCLWRNYREKGAFQTQMQGNLQKIKNSLSMNIFKRMIHILPIFNVLYGYRNTMRQLLSGVEKSILVE